MDLALALTKNEPRLRGKVQLEGVKIPELKMAPWNTGVIELYTHFGRIKQYKSMVILRDCLGWRKKP